MTRNKRWGLMALLFLLAVASAVAWSQRPRGVADETVHEGIARAPSVTPTAPATERPATPAATRTAAPVRQPSSGPGVVRSGESWLFMPEMPADATQADYGAEIYRLVCEACHGDEGQGLTPQWRSEWAPEDQNCWQSKCHAGNHPPDGFVLPRDIPALIGPGTLAKFESTLSLYNFIRATMPWQNAGSLMDEEYWQVTLFLAREHELSVGDLPFDEARAAEQLLSP